MPRTDRHFGRYIPAALVAAGLVALVLFARETEWLERLTDPEALQTVVEGLGAFGPLAVVLLLASAIVFSPIPSAPIAIVAGAAYGVVWGTVLTVVGACLGAVTAFVIARFLAYNAVRRWETVRRPLEWLERGNSQNWLMAAVFLTRLAPFLSFDAISYAAGLTPLTFWRFALATLAGVTPISFLLAYGGEAAIGGGDPVLMLLAFGGITGIPLLATLLWARWKRRKT